MNMDWKRLDQWVELYRNIKRMPRVRLELSGNESAKKVFRSFSSRHRFVVIPKKAVGVALVKVPDNFADYLKEKGELKRKRTRALKRGYSVSLFDPQKYLDDILAVNASMGERQGRAIDSEYLDRESVRRYFAGKQWVFGAFHEGRMCGYIDVLLHGNVCIISRILGHAEHMDNGVMYLLVSELVQQMISFRNERGTPQWLMYDTMFGASEGLRTFKEKCGFTPFYVRWQWKEAA